MTFGQAIEEMKIGQRVARSGWNGKGMWVALTPAIAVNTKEPHWSRGAMKAYEDSGSPDVIQIGAHIDMKAADGSLVIGWLASQTDMLAEDWEVLS